MLFDSPKRDGRKELDREIQRITNTLVATDPTEEEYQKLVEHLDNLVKIRENMKPDLKLDLNTLLYLGGHIVGILLITKFEKTDIITTKALHFLPKWRV